MWNRTITMVSAGKSFSMTGIRIAWMFGPAELIKMSFKIHVNTQYSIYEPIMNALADTLSIINN